MKRPGILLVISGPSGAGKGTIASALASSADDIELSVSATTREKRVGEKEGITYHYVPEKTFIDNINEGTFLEYATVYGHYYGTPRDKVIELLNKNIDVILEIDIQGALQVKENYKDAVCVFILPPSIDVLKERIVCRAREPLAEIEKRLSKTQEELSYVDKYDYVVVNDVLDKAVDQIKCIIEAEKCKSKHRFAR